MLKSITHGSCKCIKKGSINQCASVKFNCVMRCDIEGSYLWSRFTVHFFLKREYFISSI